MSESIVSKWLSMQDINLITKGNKSANNLMLIPYWQNVLSDQASVNGVKYVIKDDLYYIVVDDIWIYSCENDVNPVEHLIGNNSYEPLTVENIKSAPKFTIPKQTLKWIVSSVTKSTCVIQINESVLDIQCTNETNKRNASEWLEMVIFI